MALRKPLVSWEAGNRRYDAEDAYTLAAWAQFLLHLIQTKRSYPSHPALQAVQSCIDEVGYRVGLLGLAPTEASRATYRQTLLRHVQQEGP